MGRLNLTTKFTLIFESLAIEVVSKVNVTIFDEQGT